MCPSFGSESETFIRDLANGLNIRNDLRVFCHANYYVGDNSSGLDIVASKCLWRGRVRLLNTVANILSMFSSYNYEETRFWMDRSILKREINSIIREFCPDVIYADYGSLGVHLVDLAHEMRCQLLVHFHGYDLSSALSDTCYLQALKELSVSGARLIVPSEHMKRLLCIATGYNENIEVIPYGPDLALAKQSKRVGKAAMPTISALGRMTAKKNPLALLEAFRLVKHSVPTARLEWVGGGELMPAVKERVKLYNLEDSVILHGVLKHEEALKIVASSHIFAQHSSTAPNGDQEGLPVSILEALAMNVPVVSTIHSGIPEAIIEGVNGFLVREHDYTKMAERLVSILLGDKVLSNAAAMSSYSSDKRLAEFERVLQTLSSCKAVIGGEE